MVSLNTFKAITEAGIKNISDTAMHNPKVQEGIKKAASKIVKEQPIKASENIAAEQTASTGKVKETISKIAKGAKESSHSISTVADTASAIKEKGIKDALPDIKEGTKELLGINDINAAREAEGRIGAVKEVAKVGVKGLFTLIGGAAGFLIPVPGAQIVGMVLGEKLGAKLVGKRFTQKIVEKAGETLVKIEKESSKEVIEEAAKIGENLDKSV